MKCPKCNYLGFETGDRCRNCGYDFSLAVPSLNVTAGDADLTLRVAEQDGSAAPGWLDSVELHGTPGADDLHDVPPATTPAASPVPADLPRVSTSRPAVESALPLFTPTAEDDPDEPLIRLPMAPRPPLAVRRTPDVPRLRAVPKPVPRPREPEPVLEFAADLQDAPAAGLEPQTRSRQAAPTSNSPLAAPGARIAAAGIDHAILLGIDAAVIYLTVRMAGLTMSEWTLLPLAPLVAFLVLVKFGYFSAFTAVGGQTIGKMAAQVRVVADSGGAVDAGVAMTRAIIGTLTAATFGLGFLPALVAADRRALHDRLAGTRVVSQRPA
jgi:uncharacterized RDD family membrane protein YckC